MTRTGRTALLTTAALLVAACGSDPASDGSGANGSVGGSSVSSETSSNTPSTGGAKSSTTKQEAVGGTTSSEPDESSEGGTGSSSGGSSSSTSRRFGTGGRASSSAATGGSSATSSSASRGGASSSSSKASGGTSSTTSTKAAGGTSAATTSTSATGLGKFSFFVTSYAAMVKLSGNNLGFGGKLDYSGSAGIDGADKICGAVAELSMPGASAKGWKAFLSTSTTNAIDRITYEGPFYDRQGRTVASSKAGLLATRPTGADSAIVNDLPNENGTPNHNPDGTEVDNHDVLTGTNTQGKATGHLCNDWKDNTQTGQVQIGHSWPAHGDSWIATHTVSGCKPGVTFLNNSNAESGSQGTVGSMGGYGAIYCFASQP